MEIFEPITEIAPTWCVTSYLIILYMRVVRVCTNYHLRFTTTITEIFSLFVSMGCPWGVHSVTKIHQHISLLLFFACEQLLYDLEKHWQKQLFIGTPIVTYNTFLVWVWLNRSYRLFSPQVYVHNLSACL